MQMTPRQKSCLAFVLFTWAAIVIGLFAVDADGQVLMEVGASWCGPCQSMRPTMELLSRDGVRFAKIDFDAERERCKTLGVGSIPCFIGLDKDNREVGRIVGATTSEALRALWAK